VNLIQANIDEYWEEIKHGFNSIKKAYNAIILVMICIIKEIQTVLCNSCKFM